MKLTKATLEESRDILNIFFGNTKYSFKYSSFFDSCNNNHITTLFTNKQFRVETSIKNKHLFYSFDSKDIKFSFFKYDLENKLTK